MELPKPTRQTLDTWDAVAPPPPAERRKMFGMPCAFGNGNMCVGVYGARLQSSLHGPRSRICPCSRSITGA